MIFHENRLLADDLMSSAAVVIGALRVNSLIHGLLHQSFQKSN